jgi:hypothetical protein
LFLGVLLATTPAAASGQTYVRPDCRGPQGARPPARFDDQEHAQWYRRFWTGDCGDLSFCQAGAPDWDDIVAEVVARTAPARRVAVKWQACRLGQLIGYEWARDNSIRKIDSDDLLSFASEIDQAQDMPAAVTLVEQQARAKLAGQ